MQEDDFRKLLDEQGFAAPVIVEREPFGTLETHAHPFEAKALVLDGGLLIRTGAGEQVYAVGDVFHLQPDESHSEVFGKQGVRYLAGRK